MGKAHRSCLSRVRQSGLRYRSTCEPVRVVRFVSRHAETRENCDVIRKSNASFSPSLTKSATQPAPREISPPQPPIRPQEGARDDRKQRMAADR
jgi:hypothetical protein